MDMATDHADALDYRLSVRDRPRVFEGVGCGGIQERRTVRVREKETNVGEWCDVDYVRHQVRRRWNRHLHHGGSTVPSCEV